MSNKRKSIPISLSGTIAFTAVIYLISLPVTAYIGPGAGISAIGSFLALIAAVAVAIFGFLWYPLKRIIRKRKISTTPPGSMEVDQSSQNDRVRGPEPQVDESK